MESSFSEPRPCQVLYSVPEILILGILCSGVCVLMVYCSVLSLIEVGFPPLSNFNFNSSIGNRYTATLKYLYTVLSFILLLYTYMHPCLFVTVYSWGYWIIHLKKHICMDTTFIVQYMFGRACKYQLEIHLGGPFFWNMPYMVTTH